MHSPFFILIGTANNDRVEDRGGIKSLTAEQLYGHEETVRFAIPRLLEVVHKGAFIMYQNRHSVNKTVLTENSSSRTSAVFGESK
jgi:hypothetical protein